MRVVRTLSFAKLLSARLILVTHALAGEDVLSGWLRTLSELQLLQAFPTLINAEQANTCLYAKLCDGGLDANS